MVREENVRLTLATLLHSPQTLFDLVMVYARKTKKDAWQCFGEAFSADRLSIVFRVGDTPIGYCNVSLHPADSTMFLHHGLMLLTVDRPDLLMENIYLLVCNHTGFDYEHIELHSDLPGRLWKRWGFEEDKVRIYKRKLGRFIP